LCFVGWNQESDAKVSNSVRSVLTECRNKRKIHYTGTVCKYMPLKGPIKCFYLREEFLIGGEEEGGSEVALTGWYPGHAVLALSNHAVIQLVMDS
jgi:hypothetical protein